MPRSAHRGRAVLAALLVGGLLATGVGPAALGGPVARAQERAGTLVGELVASGGGGTIVDVEPTTGAISFVGLPAGTAWRAPGAPGPAGAANAFVARYSTLFGVRAADLTARAVAATSAGGTTVRFTQRHRGLPVAGAELAVQLDRGAGVVTAAGKLVPTRDLDVRPRTTPARAVTAARQDAAAAWGTDPARTRAGRPGLSVFDPALHGPAAASAPVLAWRVPVRATGGGSPHAGVTFVDARSGLALATVEGVHTARSRMVCDNENRTGRPATCAADRAVRVEGGTNPIDAQAQSAYTFLGDVYDFLATRFGRDGIDGAGRTMNAVVRYCRSSTCPYANAYWDGDDTMVFGAGFVVDDVAFHEVLHGFTEHTSRLAYVGESGAINESISDVLGEYLDLLTPGDGTDDTSWPWLLGEDLATGGAIRSLADPDRSRVPQPDSLLSARFQRYAGGTACTIVNDYCGVHLNSGVGNKAGFLIAAGGSFAGQNVTGLGLEKAAAIFVHAQSLLGPTSRYRDLANALRQTCANLVGDTPVGATAITATDCTQVDAALRATAMDDGPPNRPPRAPDRNLTVQKGSSVGVDLRMGATDLDGDPVRFGSATDGTRGTVRCTHLGICTYRPAPGVTGPDAFTYTVRDGRGGIGTATVRVDVREVATTAASGGEPGITRDVVRLLRAGGQSYRIRGPLQSGNIDVVRKAGRIRSIDGRGKLTATLTVVLDLTVRQGQAFGMIRVRDTATGFRDRFWLDGVLLKAKGNRVGATMRWQNRAGAQKLTWVLWDGKR